MCCPKTLFLLFFAGRALTGPTSGRMLPVLSFLFGFSASLTPNYASLPWPDSVGSSESSAYFEPRSEESPGPLKSSPYSPLSISTLDCGRPSLAVPLIVNGVVDSPALHPWHVAIYRLFLLPHGPKYEFWCGGSLISRFVVITAAHCTWKVAPDKLLVALGKLYREFNASENSFQSITVETIEALPSYQDAEGYYNGDISVIFLQEAAEFNEFVRPICLDWNQEFVDKHLEEGTLGVVVGWGLTENDTYSDNLRVLEVPVISDEKCIAKQSYNFNKYVTYTSFCAGFNNGTGVCNGDSGGGLAFFSDVSGRWYLQGLVSVSPSRKGSLYCDPYSYTYYTKVARFSEWLRKILNNKERMATEGLKEKQKPEKRNNIYDRIDKYFVRQKPLEKGPHSGLPHTDKLLNLTGLCQGIKTSE